MRNMSRLEVITGPMFSVKSEELLRRLRREMVAGKTVRLIKPMLDTRYGENFVSSHNGTKLPAEPLIDSLDIYETAIKSSVASVIGIDEAQFFDSRLPEIVEALLSGANNFKIIISGLDKDFATQDFGPIPRLMVMADRLDKLTSVCNKCGSDDASFTQRLVDGKPAQLDGPTILVGGTENYEARCRGCFEIG